MAKLYVDNDYNNWLKMGLEHPYWNAGDESKEEEIVLEKLIDLNPRPREIFSDLLTIESFSLLLANFQIALDELLKFGKMRLEGNRKFVEEEIQNWEWFYSDEEDYVFSFGFFCWLTGMDMVEMREKVSQFVQKYLAGEIHRKEHRTKYGNTM